MFRRPVSKLGAPKLFLVLGFSLKAGHWRHPQNRYLMVPLFGHVLSDSLSDLRVSRNTPIRVWRHPQRGGCCLFFWGFPWKEGWGGGILKQRHPHFWTKTDPETASRHRSCRVKASGTALGRRCVAKPRLPKTTGPPRLPATTWQLSCRFFV